MPYSFTKIEEDKTRVIGFVFAFLVFFYFLAAWVIFSVSKIYWVGETMDSVSYHESLAYSKNIFVTFPETLIVLSVALIVGVIHWALATGNLIPKIFGAVRAEKLDPKDSYHQMLQNIIDEVSVATGGRKIEGAVIPTAAMNAFALADFEGRAIIGVTEGLLARLSRAQIEAVIGHEAAHIVSGDCLATTVTSSLFKLYGSLLSGMKAIADDTGSYRSRSSGYVFLIYGLVRMINLMGQLMNMFISRQRESRADAIAVRLTRDPLSLAEALYAISHYWRGGGIPGEELEAIFIVNPTYSKLDETKGVYSDLFSTHPPVEERLRILLGMAHRDVASLEEEMKKKSAKPRQMIDEGVADNQAEEAEWLAHNDGKWLGPYTIAQAATLSWLAPDTWIKRMGAAHITRVYEDRDINKMFQKGETSTGGLLCPRCRVLLSEISYEGASLLKCPPCGGVLVGENDIQRILIRQDFGFSERIVKMAQLIKEEQAKYAFTPIDLKTANLFTCPKCQHLKAKMVRMFFSQVYRDEIDKCVFCGLIWFDKNELEMLQYLVEDATKSAESISKDN